MARLLKPLYIVTFPAGLPYVNLGIEANILRRRRPIIFVAGGYATYNRVTRLPDRTGPRHPVELLLGRQP